MAWEEWEQLKAEAIEQHTAHMQLNQLPADQVGSGPGSSGVSGRMRSDKAAWSRAGADIGALRENLGKALTKLADGQKGLGNRSGCLTTMAQHGVYESWESRLKDVTELVEGLADVLQKTGNDQLRTDDAIKAEIAKVNAHSENTAVGGSGKGR